MANDRYLVISDLQIPFEATNALKFCKEVQREFKVQEENVLCVGDELDEYWGSLFPKDIDGDHTARQELDISREKLQKWYAAFPKMKIANSNHGMRWAKKAAKAEIPSQMLKAYQEIIQAPEGWRWADSWVIAASKRRFRMMHGLGYGGQFAYRHAAMDQGMSVIFGHLHANAGIAHIVTASQKIWGMNVGCLIDTEAYAFHYGRDNRFKPGLFVGVVLDGGLTPMLVPYERCA